MHFASAPGFSRMQGLIVMLHSFVTSRHWTDVIIAFDSRHYTRDEYDDDLRAETIDTQSLLLQQLHLKLHIKFRFEFCTWSWQWSIDWYDLRVFLSLRSWITNSAKKWTFIFASVMQRLCMQRLPCGTNILRTSVCFDCLWGYEKVFKNRFDVKSRLICP